MKSLNNILWNKDVEIGEEKGKDNEYVPMGIGQPTMLTDACMCNYAGCSSYQSGIYAGGCI
ncbi:hypothetical protein [Clostridium algidicarnis]|uniref:hypothetical protein n=1 Tax=Clostridium algidicarnis TaxID=37659 RepID=UPI000495EA3E|nr:hypothetical protein [Clostridium algidicarnis]